MKKEGYRKFLNSVNVDFPEKEDPEVKQHVKEKTLKKLKQYEKEFGREKTELYIDAPLNPNDELSVLVEYCFTNKKELKKQLGSN